MSKETYEEAAKLHYLRTVDLDPSSRFHGEPLVAAHNIIRSFEAGAKWQQEQDAKREHLPKFEIHGRPAARLQELVQQSDVAWIRVSTVDVQVLSSDEAHDSHFSRMLSSIENRLIELAGGHGIERLSGWLERIDKDIYHVTTRQESIDIEQRRMISKILDLMRPTDEMVCGVDLASGPDVTAVHFFDTETRKTTPLEDISDEMLDQIKEQLPVSVYVAEMARRKQVQNVVKDERDVKIEELQAMASTLEKRLHFYRLLAKSRAAALNAVYHELDTFEA